MKINLKNFMNATGLVLGLMFLCGYLLYLVYSAPYQKFRDDEAQALGKFEVLNEALYSQLPVPRGVTEEKQVRQRDPGSTTHGAILLVEYDLGNQSLENILDFYDTHFRTIGWEKFVISDDFDPNIVYYKTNACVEIFFPANPSLYELQIYHDFLSEDFTPKIPKVIYWHEIGPKFVRCPPFLDPEY